MRRKDISTGTYVPPNRIPITIVYWAVRWIMLVGLSHCGNAPPQPGGYGTGNSTTSSIQSSSAPPPIFYPWQNDGAPPASPTP
jgi:hypothetical protein